MHGGRRSPSNARTRPWWITGSVVPSRNDSRPWSDCAVKSPEVQRDFRECLASFNAARVSYLVVGAYALAAHGVPRNTLDLDRFVQPTRANGVRVVRALEAFGFGGLRVDPGDFTRPTAFFSSGVSPSASISSRPSAASPGARPGTGVFADSTATCPSGSWDAKNSWRTNWRPVAPRIWAMSKRWTGARHHRRHDLEGAVTGDASRLSRRR